MRGEEGVAAAPAFQKAQAPGAHILIIARPRTRHPVLDEVGELVHAEYCEGGEQDICKAALPSEAPYHQGGYQQVERNPD